MKKKSIALITAFLIIVSMFSPYSVLFNTKSYAAVTLPNPALVVYMDTQYLESDGELDVVIGLTGNLKTYGVTYYYKYDTSKLTPAYLKRGVLTPTDSASVWEPITGDWGCNYSINNSWLDATTGEARIQTQSGTGWNPHNEKGGEYPELENKYDGFFPVAICMFKVSDDFTTADLTTDLIQKYGYGVYPGGFDIIYEDGGNRNTRDEALLKYDGLSASVSGVEITTEPTKISYNQGETVDLSGGKLKVLYEDGTDETIDLTDPEVSIVSGSPATIGSTTVTISYRGFTDTYTIMVQDPVAHIEITKDPITKTYIQGQTISLEGGIVTATSASNLDTTINLPHIAVTSDTTVADINSPNRVGDWTIDPTTHIPVATQKVTLTYKGASDDYNITVKDQVDGITLEGQKKDYKYNESLDLSGIVKPTLKSGITTVSENLSNTSFVSVTGYDKTKLGSQTVTVSAYGKSKSYFVTVHDYVAGIDVTAPTKVNYQYGEELDLSGASAVTTMASGAAGTPVAVTEAMVSGYNPNKLGPQSVTVTYSTTDTVDGTSKNFTDTFQVTVSDYVTGYEITAPTKTIYNHGDALDLTGGSIVEKYASGATQSVAMTTAMIKESNGSAVVMNPASYDSTNKLDKTLKITYGTKTIDYAITIVNDVKSIAMKTTPKTNYNINEALDVTGGEIIVTRAVGTSDVALTASMVTGFSSVAEVNNKQLTVSYTENGITKTTTYNINVVDTITGFVISTTPKSTYNYGETLSVTGGKLTVTRGSGNSVIDMTSAMVSGYNPNTLGEQTLTVTYGGFTKTYEVTVVDYVTGITVTAPTKVSYNYGETLDLAGGSLVENYASGANGSAVNLTIEMISGYNANTLGNQTVTVTYNGNTDTFNVNVNDYITNVTIVAPTKTIYNHGDTLDLTGGSIEENYASGATQNVAMATAMISESNGSAVVMNPASYDSTNKLDKTLKITYGTKTIDYAITIVNDVKSIAMKTTPKTNYNVNEALDVTGGEISVTRAVGTSDVALTASMVTGFSSAAEVNNKQLTVSYTENGITKTTTYNINVVDTITDFVISTTPKLTYNYGEALSVTGGKLTVTRGSGNSVIDMTSTMVSGYNPNTLGEQTLTVTYGGFTKTYEVTVLDYVTGITVTAPTKVSYNYGEALDLTGASAVTTMASGATGTPVAITGTMVSGYNANALGNQTVTVTYTTTNTIDGRSANFTDTFEVTVVDTVVGITVTAPTKVSYNYGEALDLTGGSLVENYISGLTGTAVALTSSMVSGYNANVLGNQTLTVTYGGNTDTFSVNVKDYVSSVVITAPTKTTYNHGENIDLTGSSITETMASGAINNVPVTIAMVKELSGNAVNMEPQVSDYDATTKKLNKTLKIVYGTTEQNYPITIVNDLKSIAINTTPKTNYNVNDALDVTGGEILITRAVGTSTMSITSAMVSGFSTAAEANNKPITVSYTENGVTQTTSYNINVIDSITGFTISTTPKATYNYGEALDVTTGKLTIQRGSGSAVIDMTTAMVSGYNPNTLGEQTLTVTYGGFTKTYNVEVLDSIIDLILVAPSKTIYEYGEELDLSDATVKVVMASGTNVPAVPVTSAMISEYNKNTKGAQTVVVTYQGLSKDFGVTVEDNVQSISMQTNPTKTTYRYGEQIDLTNAKIQTVSSSGDIQTIPVTNSMITGYSATTLGPQAITVTYNGKTTNFNVTVEDYVTGIEIIEPAKKSYKLNETLDLTDGKVRTIMASAASGTLVDMTPVMVSGFTTATEGAKELTVLYQGFTKKFQITVSDAITGITIQSPTKTVYKYGEALDLTGATVVANKESGATTVPVNVTLEMVSGYNPNALGTQTVTVTYEGKTNTFNVEVIDWDKELRITSLPAKPKTKYEYNEDLDVEGGKVAIYTASGVISDTMPGNAPVAMTAGMVTGFSSTVEGTQTLTVTWGGFTTTYDINLFDTIKGISMKSTPNKTEYNYEENLDLTGATIKVVKTSGEYIVPVTDTMASGYNPKQSGEQVVTISYGGKTTNFLVTVGEKPAEKPVEKEKPTQKNVRPAVQPTPVVEPTPIVEPIDGKEPTNINKPDNNNNKPQEKPTVTLGAQDKKQITKDEIILLSIAGASMLIAIALLIGLKRNNAEIYAIVDGKVQYAGRGKITPDGRYIDITKHIRNYNDNAAIRIIIKEKLADKIGNGDVRVKINNKVVTCKISKDNDKCVINVQ